MSFHHTLLLSSILCYDFARENHNYPFCSPAFFIRIFLLTVIL